MTTDITTAKNLIEILRQNPVVYKPIEDDVLFLEAVIAELDISWCIGTMCTKDGQKCLVGAAAFLSGANYFTMFHVRHQRELLHTDQDSSEIFSTLFEYEYQIYDIEEKVAKRLKNLLQIPDSVVEDEDDFGDGYIYEEDVIDTVTNFNDSSRSYVIDLRPELVAAVERLQEARVD